MTMWNRNPDFLMCILEYWNSYDELYQTHEID